MNRFKTLLIAFSSIAVAAAGARAAENVILTVDVAQAVSQYYKLGEFEAEMKKAQEEVRSKASGMEEEGKKLVEEFQSFREDAGSDILMDDAKKEAATNAQAKLEEIRKKEQEMGQFLQSARAQFAKREQQQLSLFYKEIAEVVGEIAGERSATLVLDISAGAGGQLPVLFSDGSNDITAEVISRINADAPAAE